MYATSHYKLINITCKSINWYKNEAVCSLREWFMTQISSFEASHVHHGCNWTSQSLLFRFFAATLDWYRAWRLVKLKVMDIDVHIYEDEFCHFLSSNSSNYRHGSLSIIGSRRLELIANGQFSMGMKHLLLV